VLDSALLNAALTVSRAGAELPDRETVTNGAWTSGIR
jgi:hypothetical protein